MNTDRIEKSIVLPAARQQVWRAISLAENFGSWFGADFDGPFAAGARLRGSIEPTSVDPEVAALQKPHAGKSFEFHVVEVEPASKLSFRWHPYAAGAAAELGSEPMTLVEFELSDQGQGTLLRITESGFDQLPVERRREAYAANEGGWTHQCQLVLKYLALHPGL